jgi:hypothetical protein
LTILLLLVVALVEKVAEALVDLFLHQVTCFLALVIQSRLALEVLARRGAEVLLELLGQTLL